MADLSKFVEYAKSFFLQRAAGYCLIVLSSLFVLCPLGVLQTNFEGNCILYADATIAFFSNDSSIQFGAKSVCQYNLAVSAIFSLIYSLAMIACYFFLYIRDRENGEIDLGRLWFLIHGLVEVVVMVFMLVSACIISHGFTTLCGSLTDNVRVDRCVDAQYSHIGSYDVGNFYTCLAVGTAGSWFQFVFWLLHSAFVMWKLWRLNMLPVLPDWMKPFSSS